MSQSNDSANVTDPSEEFSGIALSIGFIVYAAIWVLSVGRYFNIASTSDFALGCYIVALLALAVGVVGMGFELANKEVSVFLKRAVTGNLPTGIWGRPSASTWENLGMTAGMLVVVVIIHLIGIELFDASGVASGIVKVVVLICVGFVVMGLATVIDTLLIKPLITVPAYRLSEIARLYEHQEVQHDNHSQSGNLVRTTHPFRRVGVVILVAGDILGAIYTFWQVVSGIWNSIT